MGGKRWKALDVDNGCGVSTVECQRMSEDRGLALVVPKPSNKLIEINGLLTHSMSQTVFLNEKDYIL